MLFHIGSLIPPSFHICFSPVNSLIFQFLIKAIDYQQDTWISISNRNLNLLVFISFISICLEFRNLKLRAQVSFQNCLDI